jgi:hypothetical protein
VRNKAEKKIYWKQENFSNRHEALFQHSSKNNSDIEMVLNAAEVLGNAPKYEITTMR